MSRLKFIARLSLASLLFVGACARKNDEQAGTRGANSIDPLEEPEEVEVDVSGRALPQDRGGTSGDFDFCNGSLACGSGEGDCDSNAECTAEPSLVCGRDNGSGFGMPAIWDVCVPTHCANRQIDVGEDRIDCGGECGNCVCTGMNGDSNFCTPSCPCGAGQGDCDRDADCQVGLRCGRNNGPAFGMPTTWDVCVQPPTTLCTNGVQDPGETWIDCGGSCASCPACPGTPNLLRNGGFEAFDAPVMDQGAMPSDWLSLQITPDTYSNDGSFGLPPEGFGNFTGLMSFEGLRWVAGWSAGPEIFGQILTAPLTPGVTYRLSGHLLQAVRGDLDFNGGYEIGLASDPGLTTEVVLGTLGHTTGQTWVSRTLEITAPPTALGLPVLVFRPVGRTPGEFPYPGIDAVDLRQISGCP